jgi:hypothetical protein
MGPLKGAVIHDFGVKVFFANPVSCVDVCCMHTPLPRTLIIL